MPNSLDAEKGRRFWRKRGLMKKIKSLKRRIALILSLVMCVTGLGMEKVKAAEQEMVQEENGDLDQLVMEKNTMKFTLREMEDSPEKEALQKEYDKLCKQLKDRGVSDHITENIPLDGTSGISTYQTSPPDVSYLETNYDIDTYYQYITIDGGEKYYTLYSIVLTDKEGVFRNLAYVKNGEIILNGEVTNENAIQQFMLSSVKFMAGIAASGIENPFIGIAVSELINAIPDYESSYLIHGTHILEANSMSVNESVKYIYGYDEKYDRWIHLCSRNYVDVLYRLVLHYRTNRLEQKTKECRQMINPDRGGKTLPELVQYLLLRMEDKKKYPALDHIATNFSMYLTNSSKAKATLSLHGQVLPLFMD